MKEEKGKTKEQALLYARGLACIQAKSYVEQEVGREKPILFSFIAAAISGDIYSKLVESGYDGDIVPIEERLEMAKIELRAFGYPEDIRAKLLQYYEKTEKIPTLDMFKEQIEEADLSESEILVLLTDIYSMAITNRVLEKQGKFSKAQIAEAVSYAIIEMLRIMNKEIA